MGVYIAGMEMPKEGFVEVLIRDDGTVQQTGQSYRIDGTDYYTPYVGEMPVIYKAVPVPPHGRLIDADEAIGHLFNGEQCLYSWDEIEEAIDATETVIPAEEGET